MDLAAAPLVDCVDTGAGSVAVGTSGLPFPLVVVSVVGLRLSVDGAVDARLCVVICALSSCIV